MRLALLIGKCVLVYQPAAFQNNLASRHSARRRGGRKRFDLRTVAPSCARRRDELACRCVGSGRRPPPPRKALPLRRPAIASFGSSKGHSLSLMPPGCGPWARKFTDAHLRVHAVCGLRTLFAITCWVDRLFVDSSGRASAWLSRVMTGGLARPGSYSFSSFHIRSTLPWSKAISSGPTRKGSPPGGSTLMTLTTSGPRSLSWMPA